MSYHNANVPLADCTAQAMQDANQTRHTRKAHAHAHSQAPAVIIPKSFSHNPYVGVIPGTVDEMMRILESRRLQQTTMRRTFSSPNFFNTQLGTSPQSPQGGSSPINQFPRVPSAPTFFEEPDVMSRGGSPLMAESVLSFGNADSHSGSFTQYPPPPPPPAQQSGGSSPTMAMTPYGIPSPSTPARANQQQQLRNSRNNNSNASSPVNTAKPSARNGAHPPASGRPSTNHMELPVPASVARQQQFFGHGQQQSIMMGGPSQRPRTPLQQQGATSSANTSTDSAGVITKVYQNGRPMPRMMQEEGEVVEIPRPKVVVEAMDKVSAVAIKFRNHTGNYRTSRLQLIVGDYVLVDGDRGCDLGQAVSVSEGIDVVTVDNTQGSVQRVASEEEVTKYHAMEEEEKKALEFARAQAVRHLNNKLTLEHVSFQFDRQKLTLWYKATERVYFVPLLKALNQEYKCRIWMERIEDDSAEGDVDAAAGTAATPPTAAAAPATKKDVVESGVSEKRREKRSKKE